MPYIYRIRNNVNKKTYIGKTSLKTIDERWREHKQDYKKSRTEKRPLYNAISKIGIEHFWIELVEEVSTDDEACKREAYWIEQDDSYYHGYNATKGGDGRHIHNYPLLAQEYQTLGTVKAVCEKYGCDPMTVRHACNEANIEIRVAPNQKKVIRTNLETGEIKEYASTTEAARDFPDYNIETARKNISRALNKSSTHMAYGYRFDFLENI